MKVRLGLLASLLAMAGVGIASAQDIKNGHEFPNFKEEDLRTQKMINLEDFRGKVVLVDFWATWCAPCRASLPGIKEVYSKYHKDGLEIISISLDRSQDDCKAFIEREKLDWYHICDGKFWNAKLARKHNINAIPHAVVIGRDGKVISENAHGAEIEEAVKHGLAVHYTPESDDEIEVKAKAELKQADALRDKGQYAEALDAYDAIGLRYSGRPTAKQANEAARALREDPEVQKRLGQSRDRKADDEAAKKGGEWLKTARTMAEQKKFDLARKYYQRVIDTFPKSKEAETARTEMDALPKSK